MNVLLVNMSLDPVMGGGTAERTYQMGRHLNQSGVSCSILTIDTGHRRNHAAMPEGARVLSLPCLSKRFYLPKFSFIRLNRFMSDFDIVHLTNHWTVINALAYRVCKKQNIPYVVCPAGALPIYGRSGRLKRLYNRIIGNRIIREAAGHVAISPNEVDHFGDYGIDSNSISVIPNGIAPEDFQTNDVSEFRRKFKIGDHPFILFLGRLNHIKGPDLLLNAFCNEKDALTPYHLVFAGPDGGMLRHLEQTVDRFSLKNRVHFIGYIGGEEKIQACHAAELLVIPSRQEAMSLVVLEAGVCGTPVLITDQCGFNQVAECEGGEVVKASVNGIQKSLNRLLAYPERLNAMGKNLKKFVENNFSWDIAIQKYLNLFNKIIEIQ